MTDSTSQRIRDSWRANAQAWVDAVRSGRIESRRLVTDQAVLDAVLTPRPRRVLDLGCGEGWLCRELLYRGIDFVGVDASCELIEAARQAQGSQGIGQFVADDYRVVEMDYKVYGQYDLIVCNFSLLEEDLRPILATLVRLLEPRGRVVIQTVHPMTACGPEGYRDGWRLETFASMGEGFREPMPWYFRTVHGWFNLVTDAGFRLERLSEPCHPETGMPLSLLMELRVQDAAA
ncbi:class I SAM-dependent methyltransferase [Metapseudomonas otitidis]|uniref:class I SAM-dependent methyltransferase n=1 Tax=Metapseudomonas otitidis TaxID=319939 RepID=UPI00366EBC3F